MNFNKKEKKKDIGHMGKKSGLEKIPKVIELIENNIVSGDVENWQWICKQWTKK